MKIFQRKNDSYRSRKAVRLGFLYVVLTVFFVSGACIGFLYFVIFSGFFRVQSIQINGLKTIPETLFLNRTESNLISKDMFHSLLTPGNVLFWKLNPGSLNFQNIIPAIDTVSTHVNLESKSVTLTATERVLYGISCTTNNECLAFDKSSVLFSKAPIPEGTLFVKVQDLNNRTPFVGATLLPQSDWTSRLIEALDAIRKDNIPISTVIIKDYTLLEWEAVSPLGFSFYFSFDFIPDNLDVILQNLASRVNFKNLSYIDFRVPDRLFYK